MEKIFIALCPLYGKIYMCILHFEGFCVSLRLVGLVSCSVDPVT
jgi:hypothetical protein